MSDSWRRPFIVIYDEQGRMMLTRRQYRKHCIWVYGGGSDEQIRARMKSSPPMGLVLGIGQWLRYAWQTLRGKK